MFQVCPQCVINSYSRAKGETIRKIMLKKHSFMSTIKNRSLNLFLLSKNSSLVPAAAADNAIVHVLYARFKFVTTTNYLWMTMGSRLLSYIV